MTTSGLFFNISGVTRELRFMLWDSDGNDGVWRATVGDDHRFFEAPVNADTWTLVDRAAGCYTDAEE